MASSQIDFDALGFEHSFDCHVLTNKDDFAAADFALPTVQELEENLYVLLTPAAADSWVATIPRQEPASWGLLDRLWGWPDPQRLFVVAGGGGFVIDVDHRDPLLKLPLVTVVTDGATGVPSMERIVVADSSVSLVCFDKLGGAHWKLEQISDDGFRMPRIAEKTLTVEVWQASSLEWKSLHLDLRDGTILEKA